MNAISKTQGWFPSMMNDFFFNDFMPKMQAHVTTPAINVTEDEKGYNVEMAAPGMTKNDFSIRIVGDAQMEVKMEKKSESKDEQKNYLRKEFSYQTFDQTFTLPDDVDCNAIKASMTDGVLSIEMPKKHEEKKVDKMIEIL